MGVDGADAGRMLREEIAAWEGVYRDVFRMPGRRVDELCGRRGVEVFDEMMSDAVVRAAVNTKRYALLARPWVVYGGVKDRSDPGFGVSEEVRDFVEFALRSAVSADGSVRDFRHTLFELMSAFYRGFSVAELVWRRVEVGRWRGRISLGSLKFKNPRQIGFELDRFLNVRGVVSEVPGGGRVEVPRGKVVLYVYNGRDELPYGESDLRCVYRHYLSRQRLMEAWNLRMQRHGLPFAYATVGGSEGTAAKVLGVLQDLQQESVAVFPQNVHPHLLEARGEGSEPFVSALEWHNQQIVTGILLQTLTSGEGRRTGSMALGRVHFDILLFALECAKHDVEEVVNQQIVRPLVELNFGDAAMPRFSLGNVDERDFSKLASAMDVLLRHGVVDPKESTLREMFNLPGV